MAAKAPHREMRFMANKDTGKIEVVLLYDGQVQGSILYTQEEAESFARQLVEAIEVVNANRKPGLIIPERVN